MYYYSSQQKKISKQMPKKQYQQIFYNVRHFNSDIISNWKLRAQLQSCQIWQNMDDDIIAQVYQINDTKILPMHQKHSENQQHVIRCLGYCSADNNSNKHYILIERVLNRLSECNNLTESQALKILYSIFRGLEELVSIFGIFGIQENCVCFTQNGKIKIWISEDLSSISTKYNYNNSNPGAQKVVIWDTIEMIEKKCFNQKIFMELKKNIENGKIKVYSHVLREISKIAELLFIDIGQKKHEKQNQRDNSHHQRHYSQLQNNNSQKFRHTSDNFYQTTAISQVSKQNPGENDFCDYQNKNSNYNEPMTDRSMKSFDPHNKQAQSNKYSENLKKTQKHKRYKSYFDNNENNIQIKPHQLTNSPSAQNLKDTGELDPYNMSKRSSLANTKIVAEKIKKFNAQCYKSAPLSPRQVSSKNFLKKTPFKINNNLLMQKICLDKHRKQSLAYVQNNILKNECKQQQTKNRLEDYIKSSRNQESELYKLSQSDKSKEIQDSFAYSFKVQPKDIHVKGDFQTFGLLDALSDKKLDRSENSGMLDHSGSNCFMDLDVQGMDRELKKKLDKKKTRKSKDKKISIQKVSIISQLNQYQLLNYNQLQNGANQLKQEKVSEFKNVFDENGSIRSSKRIKNSSQFNQASLKIDGFQNISNNNPNLNSHKLDNNEANSLRYYKGNIKTQNNQQINNTAAKIINSTPRTFKQNTNIIKRNNIAVADKNLDPAHSKMSFPQLSIPLNGKMNPVGSIPLKISAKQNYNQMTNIQNHYSHRYPQRKQAVTQNIMQNNSSYHRNSAHQTNFHRF